LDALLSVFEGGIVIDVNPEWFVEISCTSNGFRNDSDNAFTAFQIYLTLWRMFHMPTNRSAATVPNATPRMQKKTTPLNDTGFTVRSMA
jgi:hypothetical protein